MLNNRLEVVVDNERIDKQRMQEYNVHMMDDNMIRVKLEDVEVRFDGYETKVYMSKQMSEKQCGLCGHFDDNKDNEFYTPMMEYTTDIEKFHKSYMLTDQCEVDNKLLFEKKYYSVETDTLDDYDWMKFYSDENTVDDSKSYGRAMLKNTYVMEFAHRVCFSLEPVSKCPKREQNDDMVEKKIRFTCLPRSSYEARQLLHKARTDILNLSGYPVSFVENISVPRTCTVY
ncbi:hypothetical protein DICVIV_12470 [Dictyocaulus viviparus]|uniref:VWFD domain-containing protein n=1 Tax=Dictyocaulus viviparus TaxID=29172 RepID=A0A0D8XD20_DICVI|nr:hypothetical protein DICVIV_12470 [Dictyocaulus viviparus]